MYSSEDIYLFDKNYDNIIKEISLQKEKIIGPSLEEKKIVQNIILDFIIKNKRIIYGGFALNLLLLYNKEKPIYDDSDVHDIDFYSNTPLADIEQICNEIHKKKLPFVLGEEALHEATYSIKVNFREYANISYMPTLIYNRIPKIKINSIYFLRTDIMCIDPFRMFTNLLSSDYVLLKWFNRFNKLQSSKSFKIFTFDKEGDIKFNYKIDKNIYSDIYDYIVDNNNIILFGYCLLNLYIKYSGIDLPPLENIPIHLISANFKNDVVGLFNLLKKYNVIIREYYPFFQYTGRSVVFYIDKNPIIYIYNNNNKCIPIIKTDILFHPFDKKKGGTINVCSYRYGIHMNLILYTYHIIYKNKEYLLLNTLSILMERCKKKYLKKKEKTIFDQTLFKEFIIDCIGNEQEVKKERWIQGEKKKKKKQTPRFKYIPEKPKTSSYIFKNISGNIVTNKKNYLFNKIPHFE